jgi:hypothetical protein
MRLRGSVPRSHSSHTSSSPGSASLRYASGRTSSPQACAQRRCPHHSISPQSEIETQRSVSGRLRGSCSRLLYAACVARADGGRTRRSASSPPWCLRARARSGVRGGRPSSGPLPLIGPERPSRRRCRRRPQPAQAQRRRPVVSAARCSRSSISSAPACWQPASANNAGRDNDTRSLDKAIVSASRSTGVSRIVHPGSLAATLGRARVRRKARGALSFCDRPELTTMSQAVCWLDRATNTRALRFSASPG